MRHQVIEKSRDRRRTPDLRVQTRPKSRAVRKHRPQVNATFFFLAVLLTLFSAHAAAYGPTSPI
jgi:hypothetical protein